MARIIEPLHQQIHALDAELLELHANGRNTEALARLGDLHALRDALFLTIARTGAGKLATGEK